MVKYHYAEAEKTHHSPFPPNVDATIMIADVPVKICFTHGEETINEYEEVIDVVFDYKTAEGMAYDRKMQILNAQGLSTEDALFSIASDMVRDQAQETLKKLANSKLLKRAAGHEVHLDIKRNGEITYKAPFKE
jgi:hypothetical protein